MLLDIRNLTVEVEGKTVLRNLSMSIGFGETVLLMGPNGSGKSSLIYTLIGHPRYKVKGGSITFKGRDITGMSTEERVKLGMGAALQFPPKVYGITLRSLAKRIVKDDSEVESLASSLNLTGFLDREINVGFSGGEIKRAEIFLLLLQKPSLALLDEPDSGVDVENMLLVGNAIGKLLSDSGRTAIEKPSGLIVTHLGHISRYVLTNRTYIMYDGTIICYGPTENLVNDVLKYGFDWCTKCYGDRFSCKMVGEKA